MLKEKQVFKVTKPEFSFVKHIGSPLASYCLDFKENPELNIMLGYNMADMGKCISGSILSISDKVSYNTTYYTKPKPVGLFPVVFQNINFHVSVKIWRSWRSLLALMSTREQRDKIMDNLSQYGRRIFTVLDPYGIFMHFHNETRGLNPSDK
jgi:hypothetical protein